MKNFHNNNNNKYNHQINCKEKDNFIENNLNIRKTDLHIYGRHAQISEVCVTIIFCLLMKKKRKISLLCMDYATFSSFLCILCAYIMLLFSVNSLKFRILTSSKICQRNYQAWLLVHFRYSVFVRTMISFPDKLKCLIQIKLHLHAY